jgi:hypothetical protein
MNFIEYPQNKVGAKSPLIYQVFDTNWNSTTNFYYQFDVYIWNGTSTIPATPVVTLQKDADVYENGRAWVDVHKLVQQYITQDFFINEVYQPNINGGACYFAVKVKAFWDGGSSGTITSPVVMATNGYTYTFEGLNKSFTNVVYSDKDSIIIPDTTVSYYFYFDASVVTGITIGAVTKTPNAVTGSTNTIQGIDIVQLLSESGIVGNTTVTFVTAGDDITYNIERECLNKYGQVTGHFLNRYGVYETFVFNGVSRKTLATNKENYSKPIYNSSDLNTAWNYGVAIGQSYNVNANVQLMINTNWISETMVQVIQQFFLSDNILIIDQEQTKSARVIDQSYIEKKRVNEKLIDYTIQLEFNQPLINKIVR